MQTGVDVKGKSRTTVHLCLPHFHPWPPGSHRTGRLSLPWSGHILLEGLGCCVTQVWDSLLSTLAT